MMKPGAGEDEDVQVLVQRPYSHEDRGATRPPTPTPPPHNHQHHHQGPRPYYRRWSPWIVPGATVACVALFVVTMYVNDCKRHSSSSKCAAGFLGRFAFQPLKENPLLGPSSATLVKMGALDVNRVVHGRQGWRLITCMWLHAGVVHLLINMLCLVFIGIRLEQEFGFLRVALVYLISGLGGSLVSALFIQSTVSVGASGALFGLIGSMLSELITNWSLYANKAAALVSLVAVIALNLALGILPHVDNFAHIGGLLSGFLLGFVFLVRPHFAYQRSRAVGGDGGGVSTSKQRKHKTYQYVLWLAAAVLLVAGFAAATALLFRGYDANRHCRWCHYLSCVPTKRWKCTPTVCSAYWSNSTSLTLVCQRGSGSNSTRDFPGASPDQLDDLCRQFCT
ncbi:unnamed protein product [Urochloa humidicola]